MVEYALGGAVIKGGVVLLGVGERRKDVARVEIVVYLEILSLKGLDLFKGGFQSLVGVEERGLVHIIPEAFDPHIGEGLVLIAEPP